MIFISTVLSMLGSSIELRIGKAVIGGLIIGPAVESFDIRRYPD
jgi:hypothetical protein